MGRENSPQNKERLIFNKITCKQIAAYGFFVAFYQILKTTMYSNLTNKEVKMQKQEIYESVIQKYMTALAHCDLDGLCELFTPEAKVYSPLLGWIEPRIFFEKMCTLSDVNKSYQVPHNTLISSEGKAVVVKHFTYHWVVKDGRETTFEVCDVFEFNENNFITKETILYDTYQLRADMNGNPLDY